MLSEIPDAFRGEYSLFFVVDGGIGVLHLMKQSEVHEEIHRMEGNVRWVIHNISRYAAREIQVALDEFADEEDDAAITRDMALRAVAA